MHSMEYVLSCYNKVQGYLKDEKTRDHHFGIIRQIFNEFSYDKNRELANKVCEDDNDHV